MSKLDRIRHFLNENKSGLAIVSDPVTVNYLTGFDCDPHERQMFLFVYENREPALFVPALEVARALLFSISQSSVMWTLKIHGKNQSWSSKYRHPYYLCRV